MCACACMYAHVNVSFIGRRGLYRGHMGCWLGSHCCFCLCYTESEDLYLVEQMVVGTGLYKEVAFPQCKKAIGKLTFIFYQFSSFYINLPHAHPLNTQVLSDFSILGNGHRGPLASSGLDQHQLRECVRS